MLKVQQFIEEHDVDTLTRDYGISSHSSIKQESTSFEGDVTDFFQKLSAEQEPLGPEFEQVLFDNLWDLYQS